MKNIFLISKALIVVVILFGVVIFGGNLYVHGSLTGAKHVEQIAVLSEEDLNVEPEVEEPFDLATFVADAVKGKKVAGKCKACHQFKNNGKNGVGPNLWGIYEREIASIENFNYSDAFIARKGNHVWNDDTLYGYLESPKDYIPGNKMAFAGIKKEADRLNLIEYLKTLK